MHLTGLSSKATLSVEEEKEKEKKEAPAVCEVNFFLFLFGSFHMNSITFVFSISGKVQKSALFISLCKVQTCAFVCAECTILDQLNVLTVGFKCTQSFVVFLRHLIANQCTFLGHFSRIT